MPYPYYSNNYPIYQMPTYQPYQPAAYQPMQQTVIPQQTPMQAAQAQSFAAAPAMPQQSSIIWVSGEREALAYPVAPNNAVTLWSQNEPIVYLKQADATGKPTLKVYDLVERSQTASNATNNSGGETPNFATKDDLVAVVGAVKGIDESIGAIKADIDTMKGDMYGLAGAKKKPTAKKQEEADE